MNLKEVKEIVRNTKILGVREGLEFAQGYLDCHEKMKPLIEALECIDKITAGTAETNVQIFKSLVSRTLTEYRKEVLGEG